MLSVKATVDVGASVNKNIHNRFDRLWRSPTQSAHVRSVVVSLARPTVEHLQFASARSADDRRPVSLLTHSILFVRLSIPTGRYCQLLELGSIEHFYCRTYNTRITSIVFILTMIRSTFGNPAATVTLMNIVVPLPQVLLNNGVSSV